MVRRTKRFGSFIMVSALASAAAAALLPGVALASAPEITSFVCPLTNSGGAYQCQVTFTGGYGTSANWSPPGLVVAEDMGFSQFFGTCTPGTRQSVTVTVSNGQGSAQASATLKCWG